MNVPRCVPGKLKILNFEAHQNRVFCLTEKNVTREQVAGDLKPFLNEFSCRSFQNGSLTLNPSTAIHQIFIASKGFDLI